MVRSHAVDWTAGMVKGNGSRGSGSRSGGGNTSACGHAPPLILLLASNDDSRGVTMLRVTW